MKYGLYTKFVTQPEKGEILAEILSQAANLMKNAQGCLLYIVNSELDNKDCIWVTEIWENSEAHAASLNVEGVRALIGQAMPLFAGPPTQIKLNTIGGIGL